MTVRVVMTADETFELPADVLAALDPRYAAAGGGGLANQGTGYHALALGGDGGNAVASGIDSVALGDSANAPATTSTAVGCGAQAVAANTLGVGAFTQASAPGSSAIGSDSASNGASTSTADEMMLGTVLTTVHAGKDVKTLQPSSNGNPAWQLGAVVTAAVTVDGTQYVEVMIGGVLVKLAVCA